jgi:hypothetical protein
MLVFPEFQADNPSAKGAEQFSDVALIQFLSTNFVEIKLSPFSFLDAYLKVWVPNSQMIVGQMTCVNNSTGSRGIGMDWLVQLDPHPGGRPMTTTTMGINTILHGQTENLFPVFYLTGGPEESSSVFPGLVIKMLLTPGASRQVTWVVASLGSLEASFQQARHFSSHQFDIEQFKIEMTDKRQKCIFSDQSDPNENQLNLSQNRAYQLLMPPVKRFKYATFIHLRNPDHGFHPTEEMLEISREWSGQTLYGIWMMMQNLLPGRPDTLKGLIQNMIDSQKEDGSIDFCVSANRRQTGFSAPPLLATLSCELHPYFEDYEWYAENYPKMLHFLRSWLSNESNLLPSMIHPIQTGLDNIRQIDEDSQVNFWLKLSTSQNLYLLSFLYREIRSLIQIAGWINIQEDLPWLEKKLEWLADVVNATWKQESGGFICSDSLTNRTSGGKVLCEFLQNGSHKPRRVITIPGRIYIQLNISSRISPDFSCVLLGRNDSGEIEIVLDSRSFQWIGNTGVYVSEIPFSALAQVKICGWKRGDSGKVGQVDLTHMDITSLLPLWAGIPSQQQADNMLEVNEPANYLVENGITLNQNNGSHTAQRLPNFLAAMIIEGFLNYHHIDLADRFFHHHFLQGSQEDDFKLPLRAEPNIADLDDLLAVKLFLAISGVKKLTTNEVIITHFNIHPLPVTVQYNQIKLILHSGFTEIIPASGNSIIIDKPGPHKVLLE